MTLSDQAVASDNPASRKGSAEQLAEIAVAVTPAIDVLATAVRGLGGTMCVAVEVNGHLFKRQSMRSRFDVSLRDPDDDDAVEQELAPVSDPSRRKGCLLMKIDDGELSIRIGVEALATAVEASPLLEEGEDFVGPKVTDPDRFARELLNELEREDEDGTNAIHRAFDRAALAAIEDGAEGIRLASDEDDG